MRILLTTRGSSGHVLPLAPFGHACLRAGHDVLVVTQRQHVANVERTGLAYAAVDQPAPEDWMPLLAQFGELGIEAAGERMIADYFARLDTRAALPGLQAIVADWRPDVIVRESWEYASALVGELHGIPIVRVGLGHAAVEEQSIVLVAAAVDELRAEVGLPPDPAGDRLRESAYFTMVPAALEDPAAVVPERTYRFTEPAPAAPAPLPDWWPGNDDPLVYVSFGSVAGEGHMPYFPALYREAIEALAPLHARILLTLGNGPDPDALGPLPANVHVERWVSQDDVAPHAAAIVGHGGYGSTLGALGHGVPLVVVPLFSTDQWENAAAVARSGAGIALDTEYDTRRVLDLPGPDTLGALRPAVERVVADPSYRREARRVAASGQAAPPVDAAVDVLLAMRRTSAPVANSWG